MVELSVRERELLLQAIDAYMFNATDDEVDDTTELSELREKLVHPIVSGNVIFQRPGWLAKPLGFTKEDKIDE